MNGLTVLGLLALVVVGYLAALALVDCLRDRRDRRVRAAMRRHPAVVARRRTIGGAR